MSTMSTKREIRGYGGWIAGGAVLLWAVLLFVPTSPLAVSSARGVVSGVVVLWHVLNVYLWFVPGWRRSVIERRGPLLGVGFAFGAAFVGAVADALWIGAGAAAATAVWRFLVYALPFIVPLAMKLPYRAHPVDLGVIVMAALLPRVPGFDRPWVFLSPGLEWAGLLTAHLSAGSLGGAALLVTYFSGARFWTLAPCDLIPRKGDGRSLFWAWTLGSATALIVGTLIDRGPLVPMGSFASAWDGLQWLLAGPGLAVVLEVLIFRSLLQSWMTKTLSGRLGWAPMYAGAAAAALTAGLHAAYGPFGLTREAGFFVSLVHGLVYARSNRYFPAFVAYCLILVTLAALASMGV